jgi:serine/threonine protein kinase
MSTLDVTQMRREIEILKMSQNHNIVHLVDLFETSTHYQIVMELMKGSDMFDYMESRKFKLTESHVKRIGLQLIMGV